MSYEICIQKALWNVSTAWLKGTCLTIPSSPPWDARNKTIRRNAVENTVSPDTAPPLPQLGVFLHPCKHHLMQRGCAFRVGRLVFFSGEVTSLQIWRKWLVTGNPTKTLDRFQVQLRTKVFRAKVAGKGRNDLSLCAIMCCTNSCGMGKTVWCDFLFSSELIEKQTSSWNVWITRTNFGEEKYETSAKTSNLYICIPSHICFQSVEKESLQSWYMMAIQVNPIPRYMSPVGSWQDKPPRASSFIGLRGITNHRPQTAK